MTVYVDDFKVRADVGNVRGAYWYHLTADTIVELEFFARRIGLKPEWLQRLCRFHKLCPQKNGVCRHFHYDVTTEYREKAIAAGAKAITYREFGAITSDRRDKFDPPDVIAKRRKDLGL